MFRIGGGGGGGSEARPEEPRVCGVGGVAQRCFYLQHFWVVMQPGGHISVFGRQEFMHYVFSGVI